MDTLYLFCFKNVRNKNEKIKFIQKIEKTKEKQTYSPRTIEFRCP